MNLDDHEKLMATQVAPWVERWQALTGQPLHADMSEGYLGTGVFGARTGPYSSLSFPNVAHEMAHAIERVASNKPQALHQYNWGLTIKSTVELMGQIYFEPTTAQASRREAAVVGIQHRILEMLGHPDADTLREKMAKILIDWMPDYFHGGKDEQERRQDRLKHMARSYDAWPPERLLSAWNHVVECLPKPHPTSAPRRPRP